MTLMEGSFAIRNFSELSMYKVRIKTRQIADHSKIPAWVLSDPTSCKTSVLADMFAGRFQVRKNSVKDMPP